MSEYFDYRQVTESRGAVRVAFTELLENQALAIRPGARQWLFFRACFDRLLGEEKKELAEFESIGKTTAAQYKFEVESRLRAFYQRPGKRHDYIFTLVHGRRLCWYGLSEREYPTFAGYSVLVRDMSATEASLAIVGPELGAYLERVVAEGMAAELAAYRSLPDMDFSGLEQWFMKDSPAMRDVINVVQGCGRRGWSLKSPMNPSTCRLLSAKAKKISRGDAEIATREYWYLRWWDEQRDKYTYPYRETNQQLYILKKTGEDWRIFQNLRPSPRSSQPLRWNRRR